MYASAPPSRVRGPPPADPERESRIVGLGRCDVCRSQSARFRLPCETFVARARVTKGFRRMSETQGFFYELRRRHVVRAAIEYALVAWVVLQLASIVFPAFAAPEWVLKVVIA